MSELRDCSFSEYFSVKDRSRLYRKRMNAKFLIDSFEDMESYQSIYESTCESKGSNGSFRAYIKSISIINSSYSL